MLKNIKVVLEDKEYLAKYKKNGEVLLVPFDKVKIVTKKNILEDFTVEELFNEITNRPNAKTIEYKDAFSNDTNNE